MQGLSVLSRPFMISLTLTILGNHSSLLLHSEQISQPIELHNHVQVNRIQHMKGLLMEPSSGEE